ncbi:hypothetical protein [Bradyrhizobium cosmicum]|uniref:hypothetical protein n=1 Tax=Bradyrhizobium cosmicum TaxID=1404864 RepID=UPI001164806B|nr:hypothetical protein [Bradyrhizobium cosmicum]QDP23206.1 hypothetical protein FNV92_13975 [Bradyrhizobium cosmicum]
MLDRNSDSISFRVGLDIELDSIEPMGEVISSIRKMVLERPFWVAVSDTFGEGLGLRLGIVTEIQLPGTIEAAVILIDVTLGGAGQSDLGRVSSKFIVSSAENPEILVCLICHPREGSAEFFAYSNTCRNLEAS